MYLAGIGKEDDKSLTAEIATQAPHMPQVFGMCQGGGWVSTGVRCPCPECDNRIDDIEIPQ